VITAGHVVFKSKFSSGGSKCAKKVLVFPAYDEQAGIVEVYEASKIVVHDEFKRDRKKVEYDIAAIHLAVPLDPIFTPVDYEPVQDSQLSGSKARIAGYPRDLDNGEKMYTAEGPIVGVGTQLITHHVDTEKGQSGAPMWVSSASGADVVTGVHVRGFMSEAVNTSVRIDQAVKQWIHNQTLRMS
jgi:V8-like Glu-specific endopeptidase